MCLGNRAENSALYINSQLKIQWENARKCAEKHSSGLKPVDPIVETGTCLYEYYGPGKHGRYQPSKEDLNLYVLFGAPRVEFVCNHEVVLFLELLEGHFNLEPTKHSAKHEYHEKINNITLAFRLNFSTHSLEKFACSAIGNLEDYTINLHVLDIGSATLVPELSTFPDFVTLFDEKSFYTKDRKITSLTTYITKHYLPLFKRGGYHVLYSLPDFDNLTTTTAHIDYSIISKRALSVDHIYTIGIDAINSYLRGLWLESAAYIDEYGASTDNIGKYLLAEHSTNWTHGMEDIHLKLFFGPLQVQALCKREVILFIDLHDFEVHIGGGFSPQPHHSLSGWKLAFIVDVIYEEFADVKRLKLNFDTARFCEHLSILAGDIGDSDLIIRIRTTLIRYILEYYFTLLITHEWHYIIEIRPEPTEEPEEPHEGEHGHGSLDIDFGSHGEQQITHTDMCGFDVVTAVTQGSVNLHFRLLYDSSRTRHEALGDKQRTWSSSEIEIDTCLADWSFVTKETGDNVFFASSFDAPQLQLITHEGSRKAIFYLTLREGYLRPLGPNKTLHTGVDVHNFSKWRLAFEVDLKLVDAAEETITEVILKRLDRTHHSTFKQLIIDFSTARLSLKHSHLPGLLDGVDYRQIRSRREALIYYVVNHYLPTLNRGRHHVLYTIPIHDTDGKGNQLHTITDLRFQILPFCKGEGAERIEGLFGKHRLLYDRNAIVFLGMVDGHALPARHLPYGINWVVGSNDVHPQGVVCISRRAFLDSRVLKVLEEVNKQTTIVPHFAGVHEGEWHLKLTTWEQHTLKCQHKCEWKQLESTGDALSFEWKNKDYWRYEHEGDFDGSGLYSVKCTTHNKVSVPTVRKRGVCSILLVGDVHLDLNYSGNGKEWSAGTTIHWSAAVLFHTDSLHGLKISVSPTKIVPDFQTTKAHGELGKSIYEKTFAHLHEQFPKIIDFNHIIEELREAFEGCWSGLHAYSRELDVANPVFNRKGDLLLDLGLHVQEIPGLVSKPTSAIPASWLRTTFDKNSDTVSISVPGSVVSTPVKSPRLGRTISSTSEGGGLTFTEIKVKGSESITEIKSTLNGSAITTGTNVVLNGNAITSGGR